MSPLKDSLAEWGRERALERRKDEVHLTAAAHSIYGVASILITFKYPGGVRSIVATKKPTSIDGALANAIPSRSVRQDALRKMFLDLASNPTSTQLKEIDTIIALLPTRSAIARRQAEEKAKVEKRDAEPNAWVKEQQERWERNVKANQKRGMKGYCLYHPGLTTPSDLPYDARDLEKGYWCKDCAVAVRQKIRRSV